MGPKASASFVGDSLAIRAVREEVRYAARSDAKVLLTGDSGVGKEVVARLVHAESGRRSTAFVAMNCAGVPDSLLESELFGHARGSFTGAYKSRTGLLEQADRGTIFMDEVGEMSARMQTLLLRFFETGEIQRVGSPSRGFGEGESGTPRHRCGGVASPTGDRGGRRGGRDEREGKTQGPRASRAGPSTLEKIRTPVV